MQGRRRSILLAVIILIIAAYYYWTQVYVSTPVQALTKSNIQYQKILYRAVIKHGALLFYRDPNGGINVAYEVRSILTGWRHVTGGGSAELADNDYLSWCWSSLDSEPETGVTFGEVTHPDVTSMKAKMVSENQVIENEVAIAEVNGCRLWYIISKPADAVQICAYSHKGKLLFAENCWGQI